MGKCEPALKSCQALGPEVRNCKGKEMGGGRRRGTLRTSWKPRDQGVQEQERTTVKQELGRPSLYPEEAGTPSLGVGKLQSRESSSFRGAHLSSPEGRWEA